jgi:hypothetical protein
MPLGALLDQWEIYRQFHGLARGKTELFVDDLILPIA